MNIFVAVFMCLVAIHALAMIACLVAWGVMSVMEQWIDLRPKWISHRKEVLEDRQRKRGEKLWERRKAA